MEIEPTPLLSQKMKNMGKNLAKKSDEFENFQFNFFNPNEYNPPPSFKKNNHVTDGSVDLSANYTPSFVTGQTTNWLAEPRSNSYILRKGQYHEYQMRLQVKARGILTPTGHENLLKYNSQLLPPVN